MLERASQLTIVETVPLELSSPNAAPAEDRSATHPPPAPPRRPRPCFFRPRAGKPSSPAKPDQAARCRPHHALPTRAARATISPDDPQSQKPKTELPRDNPPLTPARPCSPITSGGPRNILILPRQPAATSWCASCTTIPRPENTKVRHLRDTHRRSEPYALPTGVSETTR